jgi:hypothetical protein
MGKQEKKENPAKQKKIHKISGIIFSLLLVALAALGYLYWVKAGDQISLRATFHAVLALGLIILLFIKILITTKYKKFLTYAPTLGLILFSLTFIVFSTSAGIYILRSALTASDIPKAAEIQEPQVQGNLEQGRILFAGKCSSCHNSDSEESTFGPGLLGVMKKDKLPSSGRQATWENIYLQLKQPKGPMPAFPDLSDSELADLQVFLQSL